MRVKQPLGKTYAQIIKFGRLLNNHTEANDFCDHHPEVVLQFVNAIDQQLMWTSVDEFFSVFPPIKEYRDDDTWDYKSTLKMKNERLGTHFGKDDFKHIIMTNCYENKWLHLVGISFMWSISRAYEDQTGRSAFMDFLQSQKKENSPS